MKPTVGDATSNGSKGGGRRDRNAHRARIATGFQDRDRRGLTRLWFERGAGGSGERAVKCQESINCQGATAAGDAPRTPDGRSPAPKRLDVSATPPRRGSSLEQMAQEQEFVYATYDLQAPAAHTANVGGGAAGGGGMATGGGMMAAPMQMTCNRYATTADATRSVRARDGKGPCCMRMLKACTKGPCPIMPPWGPTMTRESCNLCL